MTGKLVLARKNNEGVTLTMKDGTKVHISVDIKSGSQVSLVFDAPKDVEINRDEIEQRKSDGIPFVGKAEKPQTKVIHKRQRRSQFGY